MELEQAYLGMDTAIPLGIIVNELVSNSLKHAFPERKKGEIRISLKKVENSTLNREKVNFGQNKESSDIKNTCNENNGFGYILKVADNGKGIPEEIDFQNADSLGFQLVNILVEQINSHIELGKGQGAAFTIWFNNMEK